MTISFPKSLSGSSSIKQWEAAGASLVTALTNYANSCLSLSLNFKPNDAHARDLALQIDCALETHSNIALQLRRSGASLSRMRNQVVTPLHRVPEEVLAQIFTSTIFDPQDNDFDRVTGPISTPTEIDLLRMYHRRHNLLGVCSVWSTIISTRAVFWSTILFTDRGIRPQVLESYLQKVGESNLRPVVTTQEAISEHIIDALSRRVPQIRSLIIQSPSNSVFSQVIDMFLRKETPHSLVELSLRRTSGNYLHREEPGYILQNSPRSGFIASNTLIESLSIFRISRTYLHWDPAHARNLVELQIHDLNFATEAEMILYLESISLAPHLRDLKICSVTCSDTSESMIQPHTVSFPGLQSLIIGDCYLEYLKLLLTAINPGSHRLILRITETNFNIHRGHVDMFDDLPKIESLMEALELAPVDSLLLDGNCQDILETESDLRDLLTCIPELKTLKLAWWTMYGHTWDELLRPEEMEDDSNELEFPQLRELHLISVKISNEEGLKAVVENHPIQRLVLGVKNGMTLKTQGVPEESRFLNVETMNWLGSRIPEVHLVDPEYQLDFDVSCWNSVL